MGRTDDKYLERLLSIPKDLTYRELASIMSRLGYREAKKGKTAGARVAFIHTETKKTIYIHKPHDPAIVKTYMIKQIIDALRENGTIK